MTDNRDATPNTENSGGEPPSSKASSYIGFRLFWLALMAMTFAVQIISISVGWQIYDMTRNPLFLGYVGLAQFLPALLLVLITGLVADRFPRRGIMAVCLSIEIVCAVGLAWLALSQSSEIWPIYLVLVALGIARAFMGPAASSLAPNLVPPEALANAITANATAWQLATVVGPMAGGLLYGISSVVPYATAAGLACAALILVLFIPKPRQHTGDQETNLKTILAGFSFIWREKLVLGAISLDLFAVLLGGAVALLPVYARDILEVGPWGLGMLRSAPATGAIIMAIVLARVPIKQNAGMILFGFVAAFGFFTVIFGFSTTVWISIPALMVMGGCDMVSVVLRETLMQLWTPDEVRGRVNAVNSVFIGASNELGEFRAGVVAFKWGTVFAVTFGGMATMGVAALWSQMFPQLRKAQSIEDRT